MLRLYRLVLTVKRCHMAKPKNPAQVQAPAPTVQAPAAPGPNDQPAAPKPVTLYTIAAPKRPLTGTHFGKGNAYVHQKLCDAAKEHDGKLTWEQIIAVCTADGLNHKSFATYALKRLKVIQVYAPPQA